MSDAPIPIRRCPDCGEEFQWHVLTCSDCGATLVEEFPSEEGQGSEPEEPQPEDNYSTVAGSLEAADAKRAAERLAQAGIPFRIAVDRRSGLKLGVPEEKLAASLAILEQEGLVDPQLDPGSHPVFEDGGSCPACGDRVAAGVAECPSCGLSLAGDAPCPRCGGPAAAGKCPNCDQEDE